MNSVLQALLHAPPLRNFFLSDRHNRDQCRKRSGEKLCLLCDIDALSSAMFSGDRTPYSPAQFLYRCELTVCATSLCFINVLIVKFRDLLILGIDSYYVKDILCFRLF